MRVKQLGTVEFTMNSMFVVEDNETGSHQQGEGYLSAAGHRITYVTEILTPYITLTSMKNSWIDQSQVDTLMSMWDSYGDFTLTYADDSTVDVNFAYDKKMVFTPTHEGSNKFLATIPLVRL